METVAKKRRYWIIAGESSGDNYGARLANELRKLGAREGVEVDVAGMGGEKMRGAGVRMHVDSTELGVVGVVEVFRHIPHFLSIFFRLLRLAAEEKPEAVVLIDYPDFNMLLARFLKFKKIPVIWYVSPQLWCWRRGRLRTIAKICRKMMVIFPFELEVYAPTCLEAVFVGHPLLDIVRERRDDSIVRDPNLVMLLPGSRGMEVNKLLTPMLDTVCDLAAAHGNLQFALAAPREKIAKNCAAQIAAYRAKHPELPEIAVEVGRTGYYLQKAAAGIASSGTVTVEAAVSMLPLVSVYKLNYLTLLIGAVLVRLYRGFFTMPNIIAGHCVFEEFLQWRVNRKRLVPAVEAILPGGSRDEEVHRGMREVVDLLTGTEANASASAARAVWETGETKAK
ncbi:MAG: lipid-A-disaccharide synthase [Victivallaceae bacterium]|nr:lipid-A-disaccharide synthase [Victivallaceae bacterium]